MSVGTDFPSTTHVQSSPITVAWFIRRLSLAILILTLAVGGAAWLMYHGIDPQLEAQRTNTSAVTLPVASPTAASSIAAPAAAAVLVKDYTQ